MGQKNSKNKNNNEKNQTIDAVCLKAKLTTDTVSVRDLHTFIGNCKKIGTVTTKEPFELPCNIQMSRNMKMAFAVLFVLIVMYVVYVYKSKKV